MILPTAEAEEQRRRDRRRRGVLCAVAYGLLLAAFFSPHVAVAAFDEGDRWLVGALSFFVAAQPGAEGFGGAPIAAVQAGLNTTYLGLAFQQLGTLGGLGSFWVLAADGVGRWIRRILLVSGWLLGLSAALVSTGYQFLENAGVPSLLGVAWLFSLAAGAIAVVGGIRAKARLDSTWYWSRPDWNG